MITYSILTQKYNFCYWFKSIIKSLQLLANELKRYITIRVPKVPFRFSVKLKIEIQNFNI